MKEKVWWLGFQDQHFDNMKIINAREEFPNLILEHKKFVWIFNFPEDDLEIPGMIREIIPSWYEPFDKNRTNKIKEFIEILPEGVIILESIAKEEIDFLLELGLPHDWMLEQEVKPIHPIIISFDKGWVNETSLGRCYCMNTLVEMVVETYPEKFTDYLNQPV